jgi:hypothetical protein
LRSSPECLGSRPPSVVERVTRGAFGPFSCSRRSLWYRSISVAIRMDKEADKAGRVFGNVVEYYG